MCKKNFVSLILVLLCNLAYGQVTNADSKKTATTTTTTSTATTNETQSKQNTEIDKNKYAHPSDFLYEEKVEDVEPEYAEENAYEQKAQEQESADQNAHQSASNEL